MTIMKAFAYLSLGLILFTITQSGLAEQQFSFNYQDNDYFLDEGVLWRTEADGGQQFRVNTQVITVKAAARSDAAQISSFLHNNKLKLLRTAITGYSDIELASNANYRDVLFTLKNSGLFSVVESNTYGKYLFVPNDSQYPAQWHLPQVSAEAAWDLTAGSTSVAVAVLDSGVEFSHSDLGTGADNYNNIWINPGEDAWSDPGNPNTGNGIDDDNNGFVDDWKGWDFDNNDNNGSGAFFHGTAVAGVLAAKTNNSNGVAGVAGGNNSPGISIMIGNVGNNAPNGAVLDDAILYAAANGARIIQMSLSVGNSQALDDAIVEAYVNQGLLVINAAGNGGTANVSYPASLANVMAIGASDQNDMKVGFSQFGPDLEVSAPGVAITTTDLNNNYLSTAGTSFSAPLTSGVAALVMSRQPSLSNVQVRSILHDSADKVGGYDYNHDANNPGHSLEMGFGRVNALAAIQLADSMAGPQVIFANGFEAIPDLIFANGFE